MCVGERPERIGQCSVEPARIEQAASGHRRRPGQQATPQQRQVQPACVEQQWSEPGVHAWHTHPGRAQPGQLLGGRQCQEARAIGRERGGIAMGCQQAQVDQQRRHKAAEVGHLGSIQWGQACSKQAQAVEAQLAIHAQGQRLLGAGQQQGGGDTQGLLPVVALVRRRGRPESAGVAASGAPRAAAGRARGAGWWPGAAAGSHADQALAEALRCDIGSYL